MQWLLLCLMIALVGCNADKVAQLEKQNRDLQKQLIDAKHVDLNTQEKCATAAQRFLAREYGSNADTLLLDQHNHYNQILGKCFVLVEWHYKDTLSKTGSWYNLIALTDVFGNDEYGRVSQHTSIGSDLTSKEDLYACEVGGKKCTSISEFDTAVQGFMTN